MSNIRRVMHWTDVPALREEMHFGRKLRCFAERPRNLNALLAATVGRYGDREALVTDRYRLDYGKLDRVATACGAFHRLGVARGDRVVLFLPTTASSSTPCSPCGSAPWPSR
jgi:O-succinylbenzoic acid--CoA ligase